jgi:hypothetical protein
MVGVFGQTMRLALIVTGDARPMVANDSPSRKECGGTSTAATWRLSRLIYSLPSST